MKYHSGSHLSSDLCIETANDVVLTVVVTVGQFGEPVKCIGIDISEYCTNAAQNNLCECQVCVKNAHINTIYFILNC